MKFRKLRIAWSVFCSLACVLLIVLWVRSYWYMDQLDCRYSGLPCELRIDSLRGGAEIALRDANYGINSFYVLHHELTFGVFMMDQNGDQVNNWWFYIF